VADDLLKPEEIEALLKSAGSGSSSSQPKPSAASPQAGSSGSAGVGTATSGAESGSSSRSGASSARSDKSKSPTERLLEQAEAGLAAAVAPNLGTRAGIPPELGNAAAFQFQSFDPTLIGGGDGIGLQALQDVELDLRIELGRTELLIDEVLQLKEGSVVPLNKLAGDPVDILVNGRLIARGEVLVLNDNFCVRVAEIVAPTL